MATSRTRRILTTGVQGTSKSSLRGVKASIFAGRGVGGRFSGRRAWLLRFGCALVAPAVFLVLLEGGLFVAGFGRPATFFVPSDRQGFLTTNHWYMWFHRKTRTTSPHPCLIQTPKPNDTIRLFVLGESAAMGTPKPAFNFGRVLEIMLEDHFPNHRVEVVNAAMRGIDSHVVALISAECARLQPDLFLVYMGNNEVIGQHGPTTFLGRRPSLIGFRRRLMEARFAQCWRRAVANTAFGEEKAGLPDTMESFRKGRIALDDPGRAVTYRNYRRNLTRICDHALAVGAGVVVATVPVNLKDCPPLASLHRRDLTVEQLETWESLYNRAVQDEKNQRYAEAIAGYRQAMTVDEHYAELH